MPEEVGRDRAGGFPSEIADQPGLKVQVARAVLVDSRDEAKNAAAALAAAAYEDTIRRMGREFAGLIDRDDLGEVINALKTQGVLVSPDLDVALSYLSFRSHALHADWEEIDRTSVSCVLEFVERLLLTHFA